MLDRCSCARMQRPWQFAMIRFYLSLWRAFLYLLSFPACLVFVSVREFDRDLVRRWTYDV